MFLLVNHQLQDLKALGQDINGIIKTTAPLSAIIVQKPDDGLPCVADWLTCCISFMFSGSRLHREPLDLNAKSDACDPDLGPFLQIKKGFTRLMLGILQFKSHVLVDPKIMYMGFARENKSDFTMFRCLCSKDCWLDDSSHCV